MRHYSHARAVYESRIVARVRWLVQTGQLEGTNNTISYRNSAFFFLKIKAASPGNP